MSLILNEWIQQLADAQSKAEMADVLEAMPIWTLTAYHDNIIKRLHSKGYSEAVLYVTTWRLIATSPRPTEIDLIKRRGMALVALHEAVADERREAEQVAEAAGQALELALSMPE